MAGKPPPSVGIGSLAIPGFNLIAKRKPTTPTPQGSFPKSTTKAPASVVAAPGSAGAAPGATGPSISPTVAAKAAAALATGASGSAPSAEKPEEKKDKILKPVWLRFGVDPAHADVIDDTFTITSSDGSYTKTKKVSDDKIPGDAYLDLEYEDLDISLDYSLKVDPGAKGAPYYLFKDVPYTALTAVKPSSK